MHLVRQIAKLFLLGLDYMHCRVIHTGESPPSFAIFLLPATLDLPVPFYVRLGFSISAAIPFVLRVRHLVHAPISLSIAGSPPLVLLMRTTPISRSETPFSPRYQVLRLAISRSNGPTRRARTFWGSYLPPCLSFWLFGSSVLCFDAHSFLFDSPGSYGLPIVFRCALWFLRFSFHFALVRALCVHSVFSQAPFLFASHLSVRSRYSV
ncbi:hypothetical protein DFP72DRAFT_297291 [Ephemerocybe angulata]|uniref:Uncharacterized protein n=1 Tax=Ephemerocybe angulata TaxID=980116 RepID=A0A8H6LSN5_9AGAR|nr:hypothetical protein DFP72DRAFT_297291 [Tulosesus angulatus]